MLAIAVAKWCCDFADVRNAKDPGNNMHKRYYWGDLGWNTNSKQRREKRKKTHSKWHSPMKNKCLNQTGRLLTTTLAALYTIITSLVRSFIWCLYHFVCCVLCVSVASIAWNVYEMKRQKPQGKKIGAAAVTNVVVASSEHRSTDGNAFNHCNASTAILSTREAYKKKSHHAISVWSRIALYNSRENEKR